MSGLVEDDFIRATTFFALAFGLMLLGGLLLGELRAAITWGVPLAAAIGAFAYFFISPTGGSESADGEE
jgi:hypothetical protein